jgi:hypothetical protein
MFHFLERSKFLLYSARANANSMGTIAMPKVTSDQTSNSSDTQGSGGGSASLRL